MFFFFQNSLSILDWQLSGFGSPAIDISYFLFTSTEKNLRTAHLNDLLQTYYTHLSNVVRACGSNPDKLFTFNDFQDQLKKFGKFGLLEAPSLLQVIVSDAENIADMETFAKNVTNAIEGPTNMVTLDGRAKVAFRQRLNDDFVDAKNYGWI